MGKQIFLLLIALFCCLHFSVAAEDEQQPLPQDRVETEDEEGIVDEDFEELAEELHDEEEFLLMQEWEDHMSDFVPSDLITFEIAPRSEEEFVEEITSVPTKVRGAYFVSTSDKSDINFKIVNRNKKTLFEKSGKREGIFYLDIQKKGDLSFIFSNTPFTETKQITFAVHCGNSTDELISSTHLTPLEKRINELDRTLKDARIESQFSYIREETHAKSVHKTNSYILWFSVFETLAIVGFTGWQIYYIQKLLDNRRVI
mmetsp:Transcript_47284/g.54477  ORF Transcript_47284/g.54477 Transcript_47284/m.54477 type:complete len:258 (+) Transcript_47284:39-812(+)